MTKFNALSKLACASLLSLLAINSTFAAIDTSADNSNTSVSTSALQGKGLSPKSLNAKTDKKRQAKAQALAQQKNQEMNLRLKQIANRSANDNQTLNTKLNTNRKSNVNMSEIANNQSNEQANENRANTKNQIGGIGSGSASGKSTSQMSANKKASESGATGVLNISRSNSMFVKNDETDRSSFDFEGILGYKWNKSWSSGVRFLYSYDLVDKTNNKNELGLASISTKYLSLSDPKTDRLILTPGIVGGIPVNAAQRFASFKGSAGATFKMAVNPNYSISKRLNSSITIVGTRNFHEFTTKEDGSNNNQYVLLESGDMSWNFTDSFSIGLNIVHYDTFNYYNERKEFYSHAQELGYDINKNFSVAIGHNLGLPYMPVNKPNGEGYNFVLTDKDQSSAYLTLSSHF